jgi:hypothetical protein
MPSTSHLALATTLLLTAGSAFVAGHPASPLALAPRTALQEQAASPQESYVIAYFRTEGVSASELEHVASRLLDRTSAVSVAIPGLDGERIALQRVGERSVVVACSEEAMPHVLELLERLQVELRASSDATGGPLVTRQFQLRHVGRETIEAALRPYRSAVAIPMAVNPDGTTVDVPSITVLDQSRLVVVRDREARCAEIAALLESVDRPAAQVRLTYMLLRGYDEGTLLAEGLGAGDLDQDLPQDLVRDLGALVPVVGFRRMSFGVVQGDALAPKDFHDRFAFAGGSLELQVRPANFDERTGVLNIERIDFDCVLGADGSSQSFETGASLTPDEYVVLGGVGKVPVFLVLRMTRL